ncbi:HlyD family efflux transporter periplasmic adaptor subunit [Phragmitibacter flavus]|uniref:HlyD family efflux transporter periplasmic adaptor subunit n=1 Tax=Phragmitibacter flavus TaxID=2576071 RepID=A0A5R8KGB6_9BACT|nr:HlyD family efflux transporter periplasmic adaptor subunit [Phragmitibacter flavus]TLD70995.1 HlyD family efflux transporter periplasmic adaptor subunit [Phragmitibacter flavus]
MSSSIAFLSRNNAPDKPARRLPAWLLPMAILLGFAVIFLTLFRDRLLPAVEAKVATVLATSDVATSDLASTPSPREQTTLLFQASGWIEPDPYAVKASALIDGVVATIHVLEGQLVQKGDPIANLIDDDAKLKLAAAEAKLRMLTAERTSTVSAVTAAISKRDSIKAEILAAETLESEAKDQLKRFEELKGGAISDSDVITARLRLQREQANLAAARAKLEEQLAEIARSEAAVVTKDEEINLSRVLLAQEILALDRTQILAPITGRILRLMAAPGEKKMLAMDHPDSSTLAVLYDPAKLQVRVDVPLADAAQLQVGQRTKVHCSVLPDQVFEGEVTRITGEADLQRNTLQAKVSILTPSDVLRPEMLCRVEFLGSVTDSTESPSSESDYLALWIPIDALSDNSVWIFDADNNRISKRMVKPSADKRDQYIRIQEGLRLGEQVILSPANLREGQRIKPQFIQP